MDLEIAMEAQHEQSQAGDPRNGVLAYLTFLEKKIGYLRGIICSAPRQILSAELSCIAVQLVAISKSLATAPDEGADSESSDHPMGGSSYEVIQLEDRRRRSCAARGSRATPTCGCNLSSLCNGEHVTGHQIIEQLGCSLFSDKLGGSCHVHSQFLLCTACKLEIQLSRHHIWPMLILLPEFV
jgi:hypothetical protein